MAQAGDRESAEEIEVAVAVGVVEISALAAVERDRKASVDIDQVLVGQLEDFRIIHRYAILPIRSDL